MSRHRRDCLIMCEQAGLEVTSLEHRSGHLALHTNKGMLIFPSTPSDHRWRLNMRALARRLARS